MIYNLRYFVPQHDRTLIVVNFSAGNMELNGHTNMVQLSGMGKREKTVNARVFLLYGDHWIYSNSIICVTRLMYRSAYLSEPLIRLPTLRMEPAAAAGLTPFIFSR